MPTTSSPPDLREDPFLGTRVHVVGTRQRRPNLPTTGCPFCPGGLEAPDGYEARWFTNRWPAMEGERCEVVLYTPDHDASFASLGPVGSRRVVDLWAHRTEVLGARDDVEFVLVFENRGAEVGATIAHPHGQIYAFDHVPTRSHARLAAGWRPDAEAGERLVVESGGWQATVPFSSPFPLALSIAPLDRRPDLIALSGEERQALADVLVDVFGRLDRLFDEPLPYMMWLNQRPTVPTGWDDAWFNIEIVSPWRAARVQRFIAAAEVATGEYFNPVVPEDLAATLRSL
jgi:UDPglucose--hexose-1-phosphate uridylyltransferase